MEWITDEGSVGIFPMGEVSCLACLFFVITLFISSSMSGSKKPKELGLVYRATSV